MTVAFDEPVFPMFDQLDEIEKRYEELNQLMSDPKIIQRQTEFQKLAKEQSGIAQIVKEYREWKKNARELEENQKILEEEQDAELRDLAREEVETLHHEKEKNETQLTFLLLPKDPRDDKNVIMEIRAEIGRASCRERV